MWDPCFDHVARRRAVLDGYRRAFTIWSGVARGTPERPGLGLCLEQGGGPSTGLAYRLDAAALEGSLEALWRREMHTGVYRPCWLPVLADGEEVTAVAFVADHGHPQYAGPMPPRQMVEIIALACGARGPCRDYLADLVGELQRLEAPEPGLTELLARVDARRSET